MFDYLGYFDYMNAHHERTNMTPDQLPAMPINQPIKSMPTLQEDWYPEQTAKLREIMEKQIALIVAKDNQYRGSWKARGGQGAFFTLVRPWDRLEQLLKNKYNNDILQALVDENGSRDDGKILACIYDIRSYLLLVEAWFLLQKNPYTAHSSVHEEGSVVAKTRLQNLVEKVKGMGVIADCKTEHGQEDRDISKQALISAAKIVGVYHSQYDTWHEVEEAILANLRSKKDPKGFKIDGPPTAIGYCERTHQIGLSEAQCQQFSLGTLKCTIPGCSAPVVKIDKNYR